MLTTDITYFYQKCFHILHKLYNIIEYIINVLWYRVIGVVRVIVYQN